MVNWLMRYAPPSVLAMSLALFAPAPPGHATSDCAADAMLVFDGSGSMVEFGFDFQQVTRIAEARLAVAKAMPQIAPHRRIGLLIYGPNDGDSCAGVDVRFGPISNAAQAVIDDVRALSPGGLTPIASSVNAAAQVLDYTNKPGVIVVVTDGNETCGGRPCATGTELLNAAKDLTIHVIGFRAVVDYWTWDNPEQEAHIRGEMVTRFLADMSGGIYVKTETVDELVEAMNATLGCPIYGLRPRQTMTRPG